MEMFTLISESLNNASANIDFSIADKLKTRNPKDFDASNSVRVRFSDYVNNDFIASLLWIDGLLAVVIVS